MSTSLPGRRPDRQVQGHQQTEGCLAEHGDADDHGLGIKGGDQTGDPCGPRTEDLPRPAGHRQHREQAEEAAFDRAAHTAWGPSNSHSTGASKTGSPGCGKPARRPQAGRAGRGDRAGQVEIALAVAEDELAVPDADANRRPCPDGRSPPGSTSRRLASMQGVALGGPTD